MNASNHLVIIGTGISALTTARLLLNTLPPLPLHITLLDKAAKAGGRIASRTYDSGVILETGARVFESPLSYTGGNGREVAFEEEVERWRSAGFVKEVEEGRRLGLMGKGRWWEGVQGLTNGLTNGLMKEVEEAGKGRLSIHFNIEATNPTPVNLSTPIQLSLKTPVALAPINFLINTAPSPQVEVLLPPSTLTAPVTQYIKTFTLLLPTLIVPEGYLPVYHRDPHPLLTSIATGLSAPNSEGITTPAGFVLQTTPDKLGLGYTKDEASDEVVRAAFFKVLRLTNLLPKELVDQAEGLKGRESQVKRWKFSQVEKAVGIQDVRLLNGEDEIIVLEGGRIVLAGDGTSGGAGGVFGAWRAGVRAAEEVKSWLESKAKENESRL